MGFSEEKIKDFLVRNKISFNKDNSFIIRILDPKFIAKQYNKYLEMSELFVNFLG